MHDRLIDIDGYLNAQGEFRCHLRTARVKAPHTGPHLATLTEAQARQLVADLQAALAELTCTGAESYEPAPGPCPACYFDARSAPTPEEALGASIAIWSSAVSRVPHPKT